MESISYHIERLLFEDTADKLTGTIWLERHSSSVFSHSHPLATVVYLDWPFNPIDTNCCSIFPVIFGASLDTEDAN